jgi:hypothetical protein
MNEILPTNLKGLMVESSLGMLNIDSEGAPVAGVRMDVSKAYAGIPNLLQKVINDRSVEAWDEIVKKIDYIYNNLGYVFSDLEKETEFLSKLQSQLKSGKKLFFKPNLVFPGAIDSNTHGEGPGAAAVTDWALIAALMRWFHDAADISYHQMALGEAASATSQVAFELSRQLGKKVTTEAVIEGRNGDFYGGWAFFFVRKYLSGHHPATHKDDPMKGYEESIAGRYIPPGKAEDRLMVYDLNILNDESRGRTLPVPKGANFREITLHKAIVGGDPNEPADLRNYPGCILVNVPKLKMHDQDLLTNATKNLGIGLYPMQAPHSDSGNQKWKYSYPDTDVPTLKCLLPHMPWIPTIDEKTGLPIRNDKGEYVVTRTAGMAGTQADVIRATQNQGILMLHVIDAIETINLNHNGMGLRVPEGYVWSSLDCVALDFFCARYCFKTVPMMDGKKLKEENNWTTEFVHHVPVAKIEGMSIVTENGFDSPLFRYDLYNYAEERGVGQQKYFVVGWDSQTDAPLASLQGHLGTIEDGRFKELITKEMYYNSDCFLWDMQKTVLSYAESNDILTGSSLLKYFMDAFDENGDGKIDYEEKGRKGIKTHVLRLVSDTNYLMITDMYGPLKAGFKVHAEFSRYSEEKWNSQGHDFFKEDIMVFIAHHAFKMSQAEEESVDPFFKTMSWGKGKWPSWQFAYNDFLHNGLYGSPFLTKIRLESLYGNAFQYADKTLNNGSYSGSTGIPSAADSINKYFEAISKGAAALDFKLYVPLGYGSLEKKKIPNVEETEDPNKILTAHFNGDREVW